MCFADIMQVLGRRRRSCDDNGASQHAFKLFMGRESGANVSRFRREFRGMLAGSSTLHYELTRQIRGAT